MGNFKITSRTPLRKMSGYEINLLIFRYTYYEKPGQWVDEKALSFSVMLSEKAAATGLTAERRSVLDELTAETEVVLEWRHDQVTIEYEGDYYNSAPQRPITFLVKK